MDAVKFRPGSYQALAAEASELNRVALLARIRAAQWSATDPACPFSKKIRASVEAEAARNAALAAKATAVADAARPTEAPDAT